MLVILRGRAATIARWVLAIGIVLWSVWQLQASWASIQASGLAFRPGIAAASAVSGALGLLTLMIVSGVGVLLAKLPNVAGRVFWLGFVRMWFVGYFFRYIPGKLVLVSERVRLGARLGIPPTAGVMLVVWESLLLLAGSGLLGGIGLLFLPEQDNQPVSGAAIVALALGSLVGSVLMWPALRLVARWFPAILERLPGLVLEVPAASQVLLVMGNALGWGLLGLSFALFCQATAPGDAPGTALLVTWFVASYVGGQLVGVSPAGLGVREGLIVAGLGAVATPPVALAWAVGHRVMLTLVEFALEAGSLLLPMPAEDDGAQVDRA